MWGGVIGMKADGHAFIDSILHSNWELGPALPGTNHQQALEAESSERVEPEQRGRATENSLHPLPSHPPLPRGLFVLQPLDFRLIITDGVNLSAEHDSSEGEKQQRFQTQENQQQDRHRWGEITTLIPLDSDTGEEMETAETQCMQWNGGYVHSEEDKESLIVLAHTIVDPRTVVIHLPDASLTDTAVVCSLWFNAAAFWTLVDDLSWLQLQTLHVFFSGVTFGNSSWIWQHGSQVRCQR